VQTAVTDWLNPGAKPLRASLALGFLHGLALTLAFPPVGFWPAAIFALWPLVRLAVRLPKRSALRGALLASVGTIPFWAWTHQFVIGSSALGFYPLVVYLSIYPGAFVLLTSRTLDRLQRAPLWLIVPVIWVGLEYVRGEIVWNGYAWYLVGQPLIDMGLAHRYIPLVGMYGVSAWVALVTGWFFDVSRWWRSESPDPKHGAPGTRHIGGLLGLGILLAFTIPGVGSFKGARTLRVGIVQTNLTQEIKGAWPMEQRLRDFKRFEDLTLRAAESTSDDGRPVDLIVWPETMFPGFWLNADAIQKERNAGLTAGGVVTTEFYDRLKALQGFIGIPIIVGAVAAEGVAIDIDPDGRVKIDTQREYNSAFVIMNGAVQSERYDKVHLTPFGEVMPYIGAWPWLQQRLLALGAKGMTFGLSAGDHADPLTIAMDDEQSLVVATPICFEATVSDVCRSMTHSGDVRRADLIAALTNDGWFHWHDGARLNHLLMARWRCAELGVPMARAANTGISALIDAFGQIVAAGPDWPPDSPASRSDGILVGDLVLPKGDQSAFFSRTGPLAGRICGFGLGAALVIAFGPRRKPKNEQAPAPAGAQPSEKDQSPS
jgi:apolipoprotein N-acyltransferase